MRRSKNSYILAPRSVTFAPIGTPSRSLKFAMDLFARVISGFWPVIAWRSATAKSITFALSRASPTPMLITILSRCGAANGFGYPRSFTRLGRIVVLKRSFSRAGTCPVGFGRPCGVAGAAAGAPFGCGWPLPVGVLPPAWGFWGAAGAFAMSLSLVHGLAAALAHARLAAIGQDLDAGAHRTIAAAAHEQHVRERERALALDDAALSDFLRRTLVLLDHVDLLDQHAPFLRDHAQHLPALAALAAGDDAHGVAPSHVTARHG